MLDTHSYITFYQTGLYTPGKIEVEFMATQKIIVKHETQLAPKAKITSINQANLIDSPPIPKASKPAKNKIK